MDKRVGSLRFKKRSGPDLVFRASAGFVCGNGFIRAKDRNARYVATIGERVCNGLNFRFAETNTRNPNRAVLIDQKKRGDRGYPISVRYRVARRVDEDRKADAEVTREVT